MTCPICDQKPMNCDCTATERRQFCEIEDLEEEVERLRAERRWIPVSERHPDNHEQCLVALENNIGIAWWHESSRSFAHEDIDNYWEPTHWMPLPEPPEVKS